MMPLSARLSARLATWLARPLQNMAAAAGAVAKGEFRTLPELPKTAPREVTQLFQELDGMIERLGAYASELEAEVKSRTAELKRANDEHRRAEELLYVFSPTTGARDVYASVPLLGGSRVSFPEATHFELLRGELLLVASDGLVEQMNARHERFEQQIASLQVPGSAQVFLVELVVAFHEFRGTAPIRDDITLIVLKVL